MIQNLYKARRAFASLVAVALLTVPSLSADDKTTPNGVSPAQLVDAALARIASPPLGLPEVPVPEDNRPTAAKVNLGRKLFFDERLSHSGELSCGSCHLPHEGFTVNERRHAPRSRGHGPAPQRPHPAERRLPAFPLSRRAAEPASKSRPLNPSPWKTSWPTRRWTW